MNEVACNGTEQNIAQCRSSTDARGCSHFEDAGVICKREGGRGEEGGIVWG